MEPARDPTVRDQLAARIETVAAEARKADTALKAHDDETR